MLQIDTDFGLEDFEQGLNALTLGEVTLQIPNKVTANAVGGLAALIQLIVTWSRSAADEATLRLYANSTDDVALKNFARTPFGVTALNMARKIELVSGTAISWREALSHARDYVIQMHRGMLSDLRNINKTVLPILCIDNALEFRRPNRLYNSETGEVLERNDFRDLVATSYDTILLTKGRLHRDKQIEPIASLLYEAFQNTHMHAQADFKGNRYRRSIRGVLFAYQSVALDKLVATAGRNKQLEQHFRNWRPSRAGAKNAQFMEISIFDSGPGLAENWLGKKDMISARIAVEPIEISEEYAAVLSCLKKGGTTMLSSTRGNGLFRIMQVVKRSGGFIRIRSGRLALLKAFTFDPNAKPSEQDIEMEDAQDGGPPTRSRAWAEGTAITVMIPLNRGY